jgi:radical SAM protein with 4Fe4S-binding SPASM domain
MSYQLEEVQIELSGICNATCVYCTWQKRTVGKQHMEKLLALRLLDEAKELGVQRIRYHGLGESTMHPDLIEIMNRGEELGFDHSISTNCYKLKDELATEVAKLKNLSLILAIPWVMHDRFVDVCVNNVLDYLCLSSENRKVHIQMVCHENAKGHYRRCVDTFLTYVERRENAFLHLKQPVTWPNDTPNTGFFDAELAAHPKVIYDDRATPLSISKGCNMPERFLMVLADGTVVPCCVGMDEWGLGSVAERPLREVWESSEMERVRELWRSADDSIPCGHCKKRTDCITETNHAV